MPGMVVSGGEGEGEERVRRRRLFPPDVITTPFHHFIW